MKTAAYYAICALGGVMVAAVLAAGMLVGISAGADVRKDLGL